MKKTKRILSLICAATLILSLAACGSKETTDFSGQTLYGKVTEINDNTFAVHLGEWTETQGPPPEMPNGNSDGSQTPPEKPDGDNGNSQTPPEMSSGNSDGSKEPMEKPGDGTEDSENGNMPDTMPNMGGSFTAGENTASFDLSKATIALESGRQSTEGSISDIQVNDILEITVSDNNTVSAVTVLSLSSMPGGGGFGDPNEAVQGAAASTID
ncbi:MAG: hypothetical protein HFH11_02640 [Dorea sp.]|jgi:hypothetical protein|nr:hypothetical protein [Dorea sp.]